MMFGITKEDIEFIDTKLDLQRKYLYSRSMEFGEDKKNILEFTYSANLNPKKYFAEMNNRVNSIFEYSKQLDLKPVFITITAPSKYHKFNVNGQLRINPNETAKALTKIFNKFTSLQIFRKLKKHTGNGLTYFRVYEPHKSGVPHLHAMLFLPSDIILDVKKKFYEYFTNKDKWGNNKKSIDFRYTWYKSEGGAVAYIMKYITKTFKNDNNDSIQHASYWYIKHNIRRFLCSRTLAPLEVYRKVRHYFKNWKNDYLEVTQLLRSGQIYKLFEKTNISYMFYCHETGEVKDITIWQKNTDLILQSRIKTNTTISLKYKPKHQKTALTAIVNDFEKYCYNDKLSKFVLMPVIPSKLSDYQLYQYYHILEKTEIEALDLVHYGLVKNEMIKRCLLVGIVEDLNLYKHNAYYINEYETIDNGFTLIPKLTSFFTLDEVETNKFIYKG